MLDLQHLGQYFDAVDGSLLNASCRHLASQQSLTDISDHAGLQ